MTKVRHRKALFRSQTFTNLFNFTVLVVVRDRWSASQTDFNIQRNPCNGLIWQCSILLSKQWVDLIRAFLFQGFITECTNKFVRYPDLYECKASRDCLMKIETVSKAKIYDTFPTFWD